MRSVVTVLVLGVLGIGCGSKGAGNEASPDGGSQAGAGRGGHAGIAGTGIAGTGSAGTGSAGTSAAGRGAAGTGAAGMGGISGMGGDAIPDAAPETPIRDAGDAALDAADSGVAAAGTIVPLYTDPGDSSWTAIVTAKLAHPRVRVVAIVNPNSGPGASRAAAYTAGIANLIAAGVQVVGYVATGYASHSAASMEAEIDAWRTFYPAIGGIFFDEQSNKAADVAYYKTLSDYAKAHGLSYTVGNPGTDTDESFIGALDTMLIYESKGLPAIAKLGGWHAKYAPENFGVIPYGAAFDPAFVTAARKLVGFVYIQNDDLPNPWDTLPPFFGELLAALE